MTCVNALTDTWCFPACSSHTQVLVRSLERADSWSVAGAWLWCCLQSVWRCVNTHTWVLLPLLSSSCPQTRSLNSHALAACNLLGQMCLKDLLSAVALFDSGTTGDLEHSKQVPSRTGVGPVSWGVGAEPCAQRARKLQAQSGTSELWNRGSA